MAPLPNLTSLSLTGATLSAADKSGVLSSAPWLATLTSLLLSFNYLHAPGHRALSLLHLPRLRDLSLNRNRLDEAGLAAIASAPWLTKLTRLALTELAFASPLSFQATCDVIKDDAGVFGRLRRLGCIVDVHFKKQFSFGEFGADPGVTQAATRGTADAAWCLSWPPLWTDSPGPPTLSTAQPPLVTCSTLVAQPSAQGWGGSRCNSAKLLGPAHLSGEREAARGTSAPASPSRAQVRIKGPRGAPR